MKKTPPFWLVAVLALAIAIPMTVAPKAQQSGGAFLPHFDYEILGTWTFTGVPKMNLTGLLLGNGSSTAVSAVTTSAGVASAISNETGSGVLVFGTSPTLTTPVISGGTSSARNLVAAYTSAGAITLAAGTVTIGGGSASAMTLAACVAGDAGMAMDITAITAQAHTVTVSAGFNNGGAGADVATFGGAVGDSMRIVCANAIWNVISLRNVTLG